MSKPSDRPKPAGHTQMTGLSYPFPFPDPADAKRDLRCSPRTPTPRIKPPATRTHQRGH